MEHRADAAVAALSRRQFARDGLDACVYAGSKAPANKAPPKVTRPTVIPGDEYETATPPPPEPSVDEPVNAVVEEPVVAESVPGDVPTEATPPVEEAPVIENAG